MKRIDDDNTADNKKHGSENLKWATDILYQIQFENIYVHLQFML